MFSAVYVSQHDNSCTVCDIIMKFLWDQHMVKCSDYFDVVRHVGGDLTYLTF